MDKKMKKSCNVTDLISPFIDGELSPKDNASVLQHLESCAICRKEYDALKSVDKLLCDIKPLEPSFDFAREFWKKVDTLEAKKSRWSILKNLSWGWRPALGAVAALLVIASGSVIYYRSAPTTLDPTGMLIAENITLYSDYEIINSLELLENWEEIITLEEI
ncbi:MAG: hypothetical protein HF978_03625 [Desulfobacteraceae bacterium]|nr:zf-HC2 domain-containing protein [Desulfobacteraceae bacterium]MBC2754616.1 hypothetical protein [Desulfobacteraceae bacterium]